MLPFYSYQFHSSAKVEHHGENTADILLSLKNVVVHPSALSTSGEAGPGSPNSPPESISSSPAPGHLQGASAGREDKVTGAGYSEQDSITGANHWEHEGGPGYPVPGPYNYSMEGFGWGTNSQHTTSFSSRASGGGLGSPHHLPTMSVNVSMNIPMHGVPGYDQIQDQWPTGEFST